MLSTISQAEKANMFSLVGGVSGGSGGDREVHGSLLGRGGVGGTGKGYGRAQPPKGIVCMYEMVQWHPFLCVTNIH